MKYRIRNTGEIVDVISYSGSPSTRNEEVDYVSYIDSQGKEFPLVRGFNIYWDFEPIHFQEYQKWEFKQVAIGPESDRIDLNSLGKEGWELCSSVYLARKLFFYFKRPILNTLL